jgi:hypothetical protein
LNSLVKISLEKVRGSATSPSVCLLIRNIRIGWQVGEEVERALAKFAPPKVGGFRYGIVELLRTFF